MSKKGRLFFIILFVFLVIAVLWGFLLGQKNKPYPKTPEPSLYQINPQGDTLLFKNQDYEILFLSQNNKYLISILGSPFQQIKLFSEKEFLNLLGISEIEACKFNVEITTPYFANPLEAGKVYFLSFCPKPASSPLFKPSPSLLLDASLLPLPLISISPPSGIVEMGGTKNAITIFFAVPVNPDTVYIAASPEIKTVSVVRQDDLKRLIIYPLEDWQSDTNYSLTLKAGLTSADGRLQTKEDLILNYQILSVKPAVYTREP